MGATPANSLRRPGLLGLALALASVGCSDVGDRPRIEPTAEALEEFVSARGPSGFILEVEGEPRVLAVVDRGGVMHWCPRQVGEALMSVEQCVNGANAVGRVQMQTTVFRPGMENHCLQVGQQIARDYGFVYAICVNSMEIPEKAVERPLAGEPYPFAASAGEPIAMVADIEKRAMLFNLRLPASSEDIAELPASVGSRAGVDPDPVSRVPTECERLADALARARAEATRAPSAATLQQQARVEVEVIASGCLDAMAEAGAASPPSATSASPSAAAVPAPAAVSPSVAAAAAGSAADQTWRLRGEANRRTDEMSLSVLGDQICFFPDAASAATLPPRAPGDERILWFCFDNFRTAERKLGFSQTGQGCGWKAEATITISDYSVLQGDYGGSDQATLLEVLEVSPREAIACEE